LTLGPNVLVSQGGRHLVIHVYMSQGGGPPNL